MTLRTIGRKLQPSRHHRLTVAPKTVDRELSTPEHKAWRLIVCRRAGWRCEWIEQGLRCPKSAANGDRMTADHIVERRDGGALHDPANGQCLCVAHNTAKGIAARAARRGSG
jgi:5-methylcytosine-specific restriction enzyme A